MFLAKIRPAAALAVCAAATVAGLLTATPAEAETVAPMALATGTTVVATHSVTSEQSSVPDTISGVHKLIVSCDGVTAKKGVTITQKHRGDLKIKQLSTHPVSDSLVWAVDGKGHSVRPQKIANGHTKIWTFVRPGKYTVWVLRARPENCNNSGFGHGNYTWIYTVTYQGR